MLELLQKYLDLSQPSSRHLHAKLKACETVEEAFEVLATSGWHLSPSLANKIRADKSTKEELKQAVALQEELIEKVEDLKAEANDVKAEIVEQGAKAQYSRNHVDTNDILD